MNTTFSVRGWLRAVSAAAIALLLVAAMQQSSRAAVILVFSQNGTGNTFFGTNDGLGQTTSTTLSATNVAVTISGYAGGGTPISAFFNLAATSTAWPQRWDQTSANGFQGRSRSLPHREAGAPII